jgi:hypothetical protein
MKKRAYFRTLSSRWSISVLFHCDGYRERLAVSDRKCAEINNVGPVKLHIYQFIMMNKSDTISAIFKYRTSIQVC